MGIFGGKAAEPTLDEVHEQQARRPSAAEAIATGKRKKSVSNREVTGAGQITTRQSIIPVAMVTVLFFLWGFAYGLLDVLNSRFQVALDISKGESSGLQAAYFGYVVNARLFGAEAKLTIS
jgi:FHS family L-fucose permease-like MFS transporter